MNKLNVSEDEKYAEWLKKIYSRDLNSSFWNECLHFCSNLLILPEEKFRECIIKMFLTLKNKGFNNTYPYVSIALMVMRYLLIVY